MRGLHSFIPSFLSIFDSKEYEKDNQFNIQNSVSIKLEASAYHANSRLTWLEFECNIKRKNKFDTFKIMRNMKCEEKNRHWAREKYDSIVISLRKSSLTITTIYIHSLVEKKKHQKDERYLNMKKTSTKLHPSNNMLETSHFVLRYKFINIFLQCKFGDEREYSVFLFSSYYLK